MELENRDKLIKDYNEEIRKTDTDLNIIFNLYDKLETPFLSNELYPDMSYKNYESEYINLYRKLKIIESTKLTHYKRSNEVEAVVFVFGTNNYKFIEWFLNNYKNRYITKHLLDDINIYYWSTAKIPISIGEINDVKIFDLIYNFIEKYKKFKEQYLFNIALKYSKLHILDHIYNKIKNNLKISISYCFINNDFEKAKWLCNHNFLPRNLDITFALQQRINTDYVLFLMKMSNDALSKTHMKLALQSNNETIINYLFDKKCPVDKYCFRAANSKYQKRLIDINCEYEIAFVNSDVIDYILRNFDYEFVKTNIKNGTFENLFKHKIY